MKRIKKALFILMITSLATSGFSVEWPQEKHSETDIISDFGQNIGNKMNTSIIFSEQSEIKAVKDGKVLIIMSDIEDDSEFFPSALGTSVILSHSDDIISVYSNLDRETVKESLDGKTTVSEGEIIGETGNSAWQNTHSSLEFQIIDIQKSAAINPKILLPRTEKELDYSLNGIVLRNKEGTYFDLKERKSFPSGSYRVYHKRNSVAMPYKVSSTINGVLVDEISFDTINTQNGRLYITGKKQYTSADLFPTEELILSGDFMLTPGKSTLGITVETYLGKTKQVNYNLTIY